MRVVISNLITQPVCNEDGDVVGLLDITKVFHEALAKVERGSAATSQLSAALAGVQSELGNGIAANPQAAAMLAFVDSLKDKTALPDLSTVIDRRSGPAMVTPRTTVREAAKLMKERRTTAVCVMEPSGANGSAISGQNGNAIGPPRSQVSSRPRTLSCVSLLPGSMRSAARSSEL